AAAGRAEPAHDMGHAGGAEADLRVLVAAVDLAEHRLVGDEQVVEVDLAVAADHGPVQGGDVAADAQAGGVGGGEEHGGAAAIARLAGGAGHDDEEARAV